MLTCADGKIYTGHTDDLDRRIAQHEAGTFPDCYTYRRRPVQLLWSETFSTRIEALEVERKLKRWSNPKKQAMARGDWAAVSMLARGGGAGPSTGSGQTEC